MTSRSPLSPEVRALLDQERVIPAVSAPQRARAMSRARAAQAAPVVTTSARSGMAPRTRWAAAAAAVLVASAAVAAAAYELHGRFAPAPMTCPVAVGSAPAVVALAPASPAADVAVPVLAPHAGAGRVPVARGGGSCRASSLATSERGGRAR